MAYTYVGALEQHPDHVEPVLLRLPSMAIDPDQGGALQFPLFAPRNRLHWAAELYATTCFHFDKGHHPLALDHQVDVAVAVPESTLDHAPTLSTKPSLRDPFPQLAKRLPSR